MEEDPPVEEEVTDARDSLKDQEVEEEVDEQVDQAEDTFLQVKL